MGSHAEKQRLRLSDEARIGCPEFAQGWPPNGNGSSSFKIRRAFESALSSFTHLSFDDARGHSLESVLN